MRSVVFLAILVLFTTDAFAAEKVFSCGSVQLNRAGDLYLRSFDLKVDGESASVVFQTSKDPLRYENAASKEEQDGLDRILSVEHDAFSMILALDESPVAAVINPFVLDGQEFGPFFFECK